MKLAVFSLLGLLGITLAVTVDRQAASDTEPKAMRAAAMAFLDSLDEKLREQATFVFDDGERKAWSNLPHTMFKRLGVRFGEMSKKQKVLAHHLIQSPLSIASGSSTPLLPCMLTFCTVRLMRFRTQRLSYVLSLAPPGQGATHEARGLLPPRSAGHHSRRDKTARLVSGHPCQDSELGWGGPRSIRMSGNTAAIRVRTKGRHRLGYAWKPPDRSDAARRSIESGLHTARMTLAPSSERDKPLESRKLNRYHGRSFVRARAIWEMSVKNS